MMDILKFTVPAGHMSRWNSELINVPYVASVYLPYEKRMSKNHPKIIQKLSTHPEIIQKSSSSIQKIYNNCAKNCNNLFLDDFWMCRQFLDDFWMIFGHSFFIGRLLAVTSLTWPRKSLKFEEWMMDLQKDSWSSLGRLRRKRRGHFPHQYVFWNTGI